MGDTLAVMPSGFRRGPDRAVARRILLLGGLALAAAGAGVGFERFFEVRPNPLDASTFTYRLDISRVPKPGADPLYVQQAHAFLVNLKPGEGGWRDAVSFHAGSLRGGLLILSEHCPYRGCGIRWPTSFPLLGRSDLFRCPCCGSMFTKAGLRVFGPARGSMATVAFHVDRWSGIVIHHSQVTPGGPNDPQWAVPLR